VSGEAGNILVPSDSRRQLPVVQSSKFDLIINASTAQILGLTLPPSLLAINRQGDE
jgi:hypothetical protein